MSYIILLLFSAAVNGQDQANEHFHLLERLPHDNTTFTQGLEFYNEQLIESSGLFGRSWVSSRSATAIMPSNKKRLKQNHFAEGLTVLNEQLYLLTWRSGWVYQLNPQTLQTLQMHNIGRQAWGLSNNGKQLILSDGSSKLRFINPNTWQIESTIVVRDSQGRQWQKLNELEYINGEIFANVWQTDLILRIDAITGKVLQVLDLAGLWPKQQRPRRADVLNGIAWQQSSESLWVTGKFWPYIFKLRLDQQPGSLLNVEQVSP